MISESSRAIRVLAACQGKSAVSDMFGQSSCTVGRGSGDQSAPSVRTRRTQSQAAATCIPSASSIHTGPSSSSALEERWVCPRTVCSIPRPSRKAAGGS